MESLFVAGRNDSRRHSVQSIAPRVFAFTQNNCTISYGYFWWIETGCNRVSYSAVGLGGQFIRIVPSLDMVIATTAGLYNQRAANLVYEMLEEEVNGLEQPVSH